MPSPPVTNSAYVPSEKAFIENSIAQARKQANEARPKQESLPVDPVARFKKILEGAKTLPKESLHEIER